MGWSVNAVGRLPRLGIRALHRRLVDRAVAQAVAVEAMAEMAEHSNLITALILERPMCVTCLSERAKLSVKATQTVLTVIGRALQLHREDTSRCRVCGKVGQVFYVERPSS